MAEQHSESSRLLHFECVDDIVVVTPCGDLGEFVVTQIEKESQAAMQHFQESDTCRNIVIDFCNTDYFGSSALGLFVRLWKRVRQRGGRMAMCNLSEHEQEVLKITRLNEFWDICDTLEQAKAAVSSSHN